MVGFIAIAASVIPAFVLRRFLFPHVQFGTRILHDMANRRWEEVITHVPCGGTTEFPAGRLLINAILKSIDNTETFSTTAGPTLAWAECPVRK